MLERYHDYLRHIKLKFVPFVLQSSYYICVTLLLFLKMDIFFGKKQLCHFLFVSLLNRDQLLYKKPTPIGVTSFPLRVDTILEGTLIQGSKHEVTIVISLHVKEN